MNDQVANIIGRLISKPGAADEAISKAEGLLGVTFPSDYVHFMKATDGCEGLVGPNSYIQLWSVDDIADLNKAYVAGGDVDGLLLIGSDGGDEAYGFDTRDSRWNVVMVPFVGMSWESARTVGQAFDAFLEALERAGPEGIASRDP